MTKAMCSPMSSPSSRQFSVISSRLTAAANALSFIFFRTERVFIPSIRVGRTRAHAVMKPVSSSTARSVLDIGVVASTPE